VPAALRRHHRFVGLRLSGRASHGIVNLTRTLVRNNVAFDVGGAQTGIAGGIAVLGDAVPNSSFKSTLMISGSVIDNNSADSEGGGILATRANLPITNSLIMRNTVSGGGRPAAAACVSPRTRTSRLPAPHSPAT
jgi:hypothetical protein